MTPAFDRLISVPENPVPGTPSVSVLRARDGIGLRTACWPAPGNPAGTILLLPGRSEFIEKYFETVENLNKRGFTVLAMDWRGQGGSERLLADARKGHIDHFLLYRRDLDALIDHAQRHCPGPLHVLAHSMGGAVVINAVANGETRIARAILAAPMVGLFGVRYYGPSAMAVRVLNLLGLGGMYLPGGRAHTPSALATFAGNPLTSDQARYERAASVVIAAPEISIGAPTIGWTAAAFRLMRSMRTADYGLRVQVPMLFVGAGHDTIVSTSAGEELAARTRGASSIVIAGARHEILSEQDRYRDQFWAAFDQFIPGG